MKRHLPAILLLYALLSADLISNRTLPQSIIILIARCDFIVMIALVALALPRIVTVPAIILAGWAALAAISPPTGMLYVLRLWFYIALFSLGEINRLRESAWWVGLVYIAAMWFTGGNTNIQAMHIWSLFFLNNNRARHWGLAMVAAIIATRSEGAVLAMAAGYLVERWGWRWIALLLPALALAMTIKMNSNSVALRLGMISRALDNLSPVGNGLGVYQYLQFRQPHNLPIEILYVAGIPGLIAMGVMAWWGWTNRQHLAPLTGLLAAFMAHSLVDNPHWGVPGAVIALAIGNVYARYPLNWDSRIDKIDIIIPTKGEREKPAHAIAAWRILEGGWKR